MHDRNAFAHTSLQVASAREKQLVAPVTARSNVDVVAESGKGLTSCFSRALATVAKLPDPLLVTPCPVSVVLPLYLYLRRSGGSCSESVCCKALRNMLAPWHSMIAAGPKVHTIPSITAPMSSHDKEASLPSEPDASERAGVTLCAVRLPDGTRPARRFWQSDPLCLLSDFVDAKVCSGRIIRVPSEYCTRSLWAGVCILLLYFACEALNAARRPISPSMDIITADEDA